MARLDDDQLKRKDRTWRTASWTAFGAFLAALVFSAAEVFPAAILFLIVCFGSVFVRTVAGRAVNEELLTRAQESRRRS
ncbi:MULTISPECIES: hypothetical protein [Streptomyces]|uniref:Uncharacterized protein n=1 Tax=Streptomyces venezuelae TaxID=54571 RepID=A0A5P2B1E0_STRVZ|nr:hypothetical protein [Streptomyces venezuelae]QES24263.1 hypothetical protein DEJ46_38515 [Streptomyces venezuelae]